FYFVSNDIVTTIFKGDDSNYQQYYKFGVPKQIETCKGGASSGGDSPDADATSAPAAAASSDEYDNETHVPTATNTTTSAPATSARTPAATPKPSRACKRKL
ncbi:Dead/deah box RNA helicase, partial [Globisporangium polare]